MAPTRPSRSAGCGPGNIEIGTWELLGHQKRTRPYQGNQQAMPYWSFDVLVIKDVKPDPLQGSQKTAKSKYVFLSVSKKHAPGPGGPKTYKVIGVLFSLWTLRQRFYKASDQTRKKEANAWQYQDSFEKKKSFVWISTSKSYFKGTNSNLSGCGNSGRESRQSKELKVGHSHRRRLDDRASSSVLKSSTSQFVCLKIFSTSEVVNLCQMFSPLSEKKDFSKVVNEYFV